MAEALLNRLLAIPSTANAFSLARDQLQSIFLSTGYSPGFTALLLTSTVMHLLAGLIFLLALLLRAYQGTFFLYRKTRGFILPHHNIPWTIFAIVMIIRKLEVLSFDASLTYRGLGSGRHWGFV